MLSRHDLKLLIDEFTKKAIHYESCLSELILDTINLPVDSPKDQLEKYASNFINASGVMKKDCEDMYILKSQYPNEIDFDLLLKRFAFHGICMCLLSGYLEVDFRNNHN